MSDLMAFPGLPVTGQFRVSAQEWLAKIDLVFELCHRCGLVRQKGGGTTSDYAEVDRSTASQLGGYVQALVSEALRLGVGPADLVVEIGSNDGSFLDQLRQAGFGNLLGVEPSVALSRVARGNGLRCETGYFGAGMAAGIAQIYGRPRLVVCRHTLEHVPDPAQFIEAIAYDFVQDDGWLLLEVPDGAAIPELLNVYELWDEHLYCFSAENLTRMLDACGFSVAARYTVPHLETRNLVVWARPSARAARAPAAAAEKGGSNDNISARWAVLPTRFDAFRAALGTVMSEVPRPIYMIGASHSQTNFVNYTGIGGLVSHAIDDDPVKVGRIAPVMGAAPDIITTAEFESTARSGTVLQTAFGYARWAERICTYARCMGMTVVDPRRYIDRTL